MAVMWMQMDQDTTLVVDRQRCCGSGNSQHCQHTARLPGKIGVAILCFVAFLIFF